MNSGTTSTAEGSPPPTETPLVSPVRLLGALTVIALAAGAATMALLPGEQQLRQETERSMLRVFGLGKPTQNRLADVYNDADGDLVADSPADAAKLAAPSELVFSYVASASDGDKQLAVWKEFVAELSRRADRPVKQVVFASTAEQLKALRSGELHVTAFNTGAVPAAVNACGFVPVVAPGRADGQSGITMKLIVPAASPIQSVADVKGHKITFTDTTSNSGFKAPVVLLWSDFGLAPERDYLWGFSFSHDESIRGVARGDFEVAAVASDMLARMTANAEGGVDAAKVREIYSSERFPPAALGYVHNLTPKLTAAIRGALLEFAWAGTGVEREFSPDATQFVPVNYKDEFAVIRRIDDTLGQSHQMP